MNGFSITPFRGPHLILLLLTAAAVLLIFLLLRGALNKTSETQMDALVAELCAE